jgi:uncharacterized protein (DUF433 family)
LSKARPKQSLEDLNAAFLKNPRVHSIEAPIANMHQSWYSLTMRSKLVTSDPEIMSGEPVFTGTRVPVRNLIDYLSAGHTLDDFLKGFPGVKRRQALAFLEQPGCRNTRCAEQPD